MIQEYNFTGVVKEGPSHLIGKLIEGDCYTGFGYFEHLEGRRGGEITLTTSDMKITILRFSKKKSQAS